MFLFSRVWGIWQGSVYDLTDYVYTQTLNSNDPTQVAFLDTNLSDVFRQQSGQDVTSNVNAALAALDSQTRAQTINCLNNVFYVGEVDFRKSARCQVQNIMLIIFSAILMASMGLKCMFFFSSVSILGSMSDGVL